MGTTAVRQTPPTPIGTPAPAAGDSGGAHVRVAIIGAGFTGLAMVHALRKAGIEDWLIVERAQDVGGVWRSNTSPGIACDVPSHLYSFSFAPNPDWERTFSSGRQIWEYSQKVARDLRIEEQTRFGEEVLDASWDAERAVWTIRTTTLEFTADVVIDGSGVLTDPTYPDIPGLEAFQGALFHSGDWNHEHDLTVSASPSSARARPRSRSFPSCRSASATSRSSSAPPAGSSPATTAT
jgi:cation diffusion facilitator CzcD-associated flavoprotein CzcO